MLFVHAIIQFVFASSLAGPCPSAPVSSHAVTKPASVSSISALKLRVGDTLKIFTTVSIVGASRVSADSTSLDPYAGEFLVQSDGAIYGVGFGRIIVQGKTVAESQTLIRRAMAKLIKPDEVLVTLKSQRQQFIYLVGKTGSHPGMVPILESLSLRQSLAGLNAGDDADSLEAQVFRGGRRILTRNLKELLGPESTNDFPLLPDDVVAVNPLNSVRVWVTGAVRSPGRLQLPEGTNVVEAIAAAGGAVAGTQNGELVTRSEYVVRLQRGPQTQKFKLDDSNPLTWPAVESGDTISVTAPSRIKIVLGGEVNKPGEFVVKPQTTVLALVASGGGISREGSLANAVVFRGPDRYTIDARLVAAEGDLKPFSLEDGDFVVIPRSRRTFYAFGEVQKQGEIFFPEDKKVYAVDALALAGGLNSEGTLRRLYVSRPGKGGKAETTEYNLDEYIKDGDPAANPQIEPGDVLLFSRSRLTSLAMASQIISSLLLFNVVKK